MTHHHHHHHHDHPRHEHAAKHNIGVALLLNAAFTVIEFVGGYLTGSIAIASDALHDLGDTLTLGLAYLLEKHSGKSSNAKYSYGYRRLSLVSALFTGAVLLTGSAIILWHAIPRLFDPVQPKTGGMIALAVLGVLVNGAAAYKMHRGLTLNEKMISWHMLEDLFGWVAVLIASVVMSFWDVPILDPILSIVFTCLILVNVVRSFLATIDLFLQAVPKSVDLQELRASFLKVEGVSGIHDLHFWSLDGERHVLTMHAVVSSSLTLAESEAIKGKLRLVVSGLWNTHVTIELESEDVSCPDVDCVSIS